MFSIGDVLKATNGILIKSCGSVDAPFGGVSINSRSLKCNEIFIAIKGEKFDGHDYIEAAVKKGAAAVIICDEKKAGLKNAAIPVIKVKDTIKALGDLARYHRERFDVAVIAVTGSNGKTTTKEMIACVLSQKGKVLKNEKTENNHIGVPLTLLRLKKHHKMVVLEMGMNHPGEIRYLSNIAMPQIAVVTNIGPSHLKFLKSLDNVCKAKMEIFENFSKGGIAILNKDDKRLSCKKPRFRTFYFGIEKKCQFSAGNIKYTPDGIEFILNGKLRFRLRVIGRHNVYNALAAIAAARAMGIGFRFIQKALKGFRGVEGRAQARKINKILLIDDTYNSNPQSMRYAVDILSSLQVKGKRILACADMLELGKAEKDFHSKIGRYVAMSKIDKLFCIGRLSKFMVKSAIDAGMKDCMHFNANARQEFAKAVSLSLKPDDAVLVKGSRAMKMEDIIKCFINYYTR